jgi:ribA/ribD-fused uncharacterized protein
MALISSWQTKTTGWVHNDSNIKGFFGDYRWLSNFHPCIIAYQGLIYPSSENAYQAAKSDDNEIKELFVNISTVEAKNKGRKIKIRHDWEDEKLTVMEDILMIKFAEYTLAQALISTKNRYLEETNWWNDRYWGVCNGKGENHLGKIIMRIREQLI